MSDQENVATPKFPLGRIVATPGALKALEDAGETPLPYLSRHSTGDWGELSDQDQYENDMSVTHELRSSLLTNSRTELKSGSSRRPIAAQPVSSCRVSIEKRGYGFSDATLCRTFPPSAASHDSCCRVRRIYRRENAQSSVLKKLAIEGLRARKARKRNGGRSRT